MISVRSGSSGQRVGERGPASSPCRRPPSPSSTGTRGRRRPAPSRRGARSTRSAGSLVNGSKHEYASIAAIWAATASAISRRPWPTAQYHRLAMPSTSSRPSSVHSRAPSPRTIVVKSVRVGLENGCRKAGTGGGHEHRRYTRHFWQSGPVGLPGSSFAIVTWNLQGSRGVDAEGMSGVLDAVRPDVIALQEVERRQARRLAAALGDASMRWAFKHFVVAHVAGGAGGADAASADLGHAVRAASRHTGSTWRRRVGIDAVIERDGEAVGVVDVHLSPHEASDLRVVRGRAGPRPRRRPGPDADARRRLQRAPRRAGRGGAGGRRLARRLDAGRWLGRRRRGDELDGGRAASDARRRSASTTCSCRRGGWSTRPGCSPTPIGTTGSPSGPTTCRCSCAATARRR